MVNITTHRVGTLTIKSALPGSEPLSIQIISQQHPDAQNSYAEVDLQVMQAGVLFYPKVFIRDMFGNKVIKATDDVETLGLTATIYKEEAGRDPIIIKAWFALKQTDGTPVLINRVILTEAGYYRMRVSLKHG